MLLGKDILLEFYRTMLKIRNFEERISDAFSRGLVPGLAHLYPLYRPGGPAAQLDCLKFVKKCGRIVQVSLFGGSLEMDVERLTLKEVTLKGAFAHNHATWTKALALLAASQVELKPLVSAEFPLPDCRRDSGPENR